MIGMLAATVSVSSVAVTVRLAASVGVADWHHDRHGRVAQITDSVDMMMPRHSARLTERPGPGRLSLRLAHRRAVTVTGWPVNLNRAIMISDSHG